MQPKDDDRVTIFGADCEHEDLTESAAKSIPAILIDQESNFTESWAYQPSECFKAQKSQADRLGLVRDRSRPQE